MGHPNDIEQLRSQGFRMTRQRLLILDAIRGHAQHLTADEIYETVRQRHPKLDVATVYRTLQWLHEAGLLRRIDVGKDRLEWEYADAHTHHHLVCRECGTEQQIDHHVIEGLHEHILHHYNFDADADHVAIFGRCGGCRDKKDANS
jgi:Fur family transcriptional regulator, ferric uptake regulator